MEGYTVAQQPVVELDVFGSLVNRQRGIVVLDNGGYEICSTGEVGTLLVLFNGVHDERYKRWNGLGVPQGGKRIFDSSGESRLKVRVAQEQVDERFDLLSGNDVIDLVVVG